LPLALPHALGSVPCCPVTAKNPGAAQAHEDTCKLPYGSKANKEAALSQGIRAMLRVIFLRTIKRYFYFRPKI